MSIFIDILQWVQVWAQVCQCIIRNKIMLERIATLTVTLLGFVFFGIASGFLIGFALFFAGLARMEYQLGQENDERVARTMFDLATQPTFDQLMAQVDVTIAESRRRERDEALPRARNELGQRVQAVEVAGWSSSDTDYSDSDSSVDEGYED